MQYLFPPTLQPTPSSPTFDRHAKGTESEINLVSTTCLAWSVRVFQSPEGSLSPEGVNRSAIVIYGIPTCTVARESGSWPTGFHSLSGHGYFGQERMLSLHPRSHSPLPLPNLHLDETPATVNLHFRFGQAYPPEGG